MTPSLPDEWSSQLLLSDSCIVNELPVVSAARPHGSLTAASPHGSLTAASPHGSLTAASPHSLDGDLVRLPVCALRSQVSPDLEDSLFFCCCSWTRTCS